VHACECICIGNSTVAHADTEARAQILSQVEGRQAWKAQWNGGTFDAKGFVAGVLQRPRPPAQVVPQSEQPTRAARDCEQVAVGEKRSDCRSKHLACEKMDLGAVLCAAAGALSSAMFRALSFLYRCNNRNSACAGGVAACRCRGACHG
jgi:hypothetical protein